MSSDKKGTWGGRRFGAGRKPVGKHPTITVSFRLPPDVVEEYRQFIKSKGISPAVFVGEALRLMKAQRTDRATDEESSIITG